MTNPFVRCFVDPDTVPCPRCGGPGVGPDESTGINYDCPSCDASFARCPSCAKTYSAPQSPLCRDGHEFTGSYKPFIPYFDFALGVEVTSHANRWKHMRNAHVDYRDKMSAGDLSARRDRVEEQKKRERARG